MKRIVLCLLLCSFLPAAAMAIDDNKAIELEGSVVFEQGTLLPIGDFELHIRPETMDRSTEVTLRSFTGKKRRLSKRYRTNRDVYRYDVATAIMQPLIARIEVRTDVDKRRRLFYRAIGDQQWERLDTAYNSSDGYLQAELPEASGEVVVGIHQFKKEVPIQKDGFTAFHGTPYSDTAAVLDMKSGKFLYKQEAGKQRSIASVSKLATSLVFLESNPNLDTVISYSATNNREGASVVLSDGDRLTLKQVLMSTLIPSANNMAMTLSQHTPLSQGEFVAQMNNRANELGLRKTHFDEPTGLDSDNVSTAGNIARLARYAFGAYPEIYQEAGSARQYNYTLQNSGKGVTVYTTNKFDGRGVYEVVAFKTGYLPGTAGRTLVLQVREKSSGHEIIVVLLGNPTYHTIFAEALELTEWTFQNWEFQNW